MDAEKIIDKLSEERNKKTAITVERIIRLLATQKVYNGDSREGFIECYSDLVKGALQIMVEEETKISDVNYTLGTLEGIFQHLAGYLRESLNTHDKVIKEQMYGKGFQDITLKDLDDKLKSIA